MLRSGSPDNGETIVSAIDQPGCLTWMQPFAQLAPMSDSGRDPRESADWSSFRIVIVRAGYTVSTCSIGN